MGRSRHQRARLRSVVLVAIIALAAPVVVAPDPASAIGAVTSYTGVGIATPRGIAAGPDGALWFTNSNNHSIGRITTAGAVTNFTVAGIGPEGIAVGPDGALWFANSGSNSIGRITTTGVVASFTGPGISGPRGIAAGSDGALWFTNFNNDSIGRITTAGVVTDYTGTGVNGPWGIAAGADGALWFTNALNDSIGRITTAGVVTNFTGPGISAPGGMAPGPDGALWFANSDNNSIGRITTTGSVTSFTSPDINGAWGLAAGQDGAMWFTNEHSTNSIGRIREFTIVTSSLPAGSMGTPYLKTLVATGGKLPYKWKKLGKLPAGLKFKGKTGMISGTPKATGTFVFTVEAKYKEKIPRRPAWKFVASRVLSITVT